MSIFSYRLPATRKFSFLLTLGLTFWRTFLAGFLLRIASDALGFAQPLLINELINFIQKSNAESGNRTIQGTYVDQQNDVYEWHGYFYAVCLPVVGFLRTILFQQQFHHSYILGMKCRTAVTGFVYRKALKLSNTARKVATVGEIVNLMSVDAQRLQDAAIMIHMAWSAPVLIIVSLVLIYVLLGWAVLAGFLLAVLIIPVNVFQMMKVKDERIKLLEQTFTGIKVIKMYAWEKAFQATITELRNQEVHLIRKMAYLRAVTSVTSFCTPLFISLTTFAAYVLSSPTHVLDAKQAFVSLSLLNIMAFPLYMLPVLLSVMVQANISLKRIEKFLLLPELLDGGEARVSGPLLNSEPDVTESQTDEDKMATQKSDTALTISDGTFGWDPETILFRHINYSIARGQLHFIIGAVGSGKSSLLCAILNEMHCYHGVTRIFGSIAYVPQQAWCLNATVRDNILFGRPLEWEFYEQVLTCCCLQADLEQLPSGDLTEIGERGINLSGGQKQRISLARAVYQRSDIYLLDDPLSAVDSHVANSLFQDVIGPNGLLKHSTRILVTHRLIKLQQADQIVTVCRQSLAATTATDEEVANGAPTGLVNAAYEDNGDIDAEAIIYNPGESYIGEIGTMDELMNKNGPFAAYVREYITEHQQHDKEDSTAKFAESSNQIADWNSRISQQNTIEQVNNLCEYGSSDRISLLESSDSHSWIEPNTGQTEVTRLIVEEKENTGKISFSTVKTYMTTYGTRTALITAFAYMVFILADVGCNLWLGEWSQASSKPNVNKTNTAEQRNNYLGVYGAIGSIQTLFTLVMVISLANGLARASKGLHWHLLESILHAPNSFFDTTPSGRIVNRFSSDIDTVDITVPLNLRILFVKMADVTSSLVLICISIPWFLIALVVLALIFLMVQRLYICTGRQLKRIDSVRRSPIFSHFQESLMGATSIRAYGKVQDFINKSDQLMDENQTAYYPNLICLRWLGVVVEILGHMAALCVGLFAISMRTSIGVGFAGLAITFTLKIANSLTFLTRSASDMESSFVCVERIREYSEVPPEAPWRSNNEQRMQNEWPSAGEIVFDEYSTRYRPGLELALISLTAHIKGGERIGIVGRTGAGKSSIALALFRLIEATSGRLLIDGVDISKIGLHDLRENLTIIPQDPVLFAGSLRFNLDPSGTKTDNELWRALEESHLKDFFQEQNHQLDFHCTEGGDNLSLGQRQLVCLARALLGRKRILILDEATAAVDLRTDELIQESIRTGFIGHTILTIAHRLETVMNYDRILVLQNGRIIEFDTPERLLADKNSVFSEMASEAGVNKPVS
ncbi:Multidrug resistance-associated protein 1 [Paragonimus heterotremus]|uniref:ABC-type glutathione-S-conjugate transporter n=1 Tax=Paragonimus heterotremus TaxID=100268 RepID=A0A8J4SS75_9TREM|nr:Multidrug resistance-associated protein 1 [Paragonimus heterotremus]